MDNQELVPATSRKQKIVRLMAQMNKGLLERDEQVRLVMLAALAGEHVLLLGPPGTAKSELAKRLHSVFFEANYFERLLTRFSVPEELFGPLSIQALEEDKYKRITSGYLPEASVAFIDEIFKANSAILNSLLTLLNERQFDNGNRRYAVPLVSVVAASNELPEGEELSALYDRFMLRSFVRPVSDESFEQILNLEGGECDPDLSDRLKVEDLVEVQRMAEKVRLSTSVIELCKAFRQHLAVANIYVSDRRWRKIVKLMKVSAFTSGYDEVSNYDAWILPHCLWEEPGQFYDLQNLYKKSIAIDGEFSPHRVSKMLNAWEDRLTQEKGAKNQKLDRKGRPLFVNENGNATVKSSARLHKKDADGDFLYFDQRSNEETTLEESRYSTSKNEAVMIDVTFEPALESASYSQSHINGRLREIEDLKEKIELHILTLDDQLKATWSIFDSHLWVDKSLRKEITSSIEKANEHSEQLLSRAQKLVKGFANLPREDEVLINDEEADEADDNEAFKGELCE